MEASSLFKMEFSCVPSLILNCPDPALRARGVAVYKDPSSTDEEKSEIYAAVRKHARKPMEEKRKAEQEAAYLKWDSLLNEYFMYMQG
jgi:formylmethanofuran dehydrogenase subunit E